MKKKKIIDNFAIYLCAWMIPAFLLISAIDPRLQKGAQTSTKKNINRLAKSAIQFKSKFVVSPRSIREITEYAKSTGRSVSPYDNYGNKIVYSHLDEKHILIRSHGPNTFNEKSKGVHSNLFWAPRTWETLFREVAPKPEKAPYIFQPAYLLSSASNSKRYIARLFSNSETATNTLVVVKNNIYKEPVYVNTIDNPSEFIWHPTKNLLMFTSSPDHGRNESIQIINLDNLDAVSIRLDELNFSVKNKQAFKKFHATIAGSTFDGFYVYAYLENDPFEFPSEVFFNQNLYHIKTSDDLTVQIRLSPSELSPLRFKRPILPLWGIGTPLQQEWFKLETHGSIEDTIRSWQEYAEKAQGSPLFPYTLYYLMALYENAAEVLETEGRKKESLSLLGIASEYARALSESRTSPQWLIDSGRASWHILNNRDNLNLDLIEGLEL